MNSIQRCENRRVGRSFACSMTVAMLILSASSPVFAQADRYELGRRLRGFEERWDRPAEAEARKHATKALNESVGRFFRVEFGEAARAMTRALRLLDGIDEPPAAIRWADSLAIFPERRLIERGTATLDASIRPVYAVEIEAPADATGRIQVAIAGEVVPRTLLEVPLASPTQDVSIPTADLIEGDYALIFDIVTGGEVVARCESVISVVDRLADRLDEAKAVVDGWSSTSTDAASARHHVLMLENLENGASSEADMFAAAVLTELERLIEVVESREPFHGPSRPGSHRLALSSPTGRTIPARVFVPEGIEEGVSVPLVVALHGMGGSENLFFDGYGRGAIVQLCRERGWLLVSPRRGPIGAGPVDEVVEAMASVYPVDRSKVLLVGHSMGAMQAVGALMEAPERYAGAAALGGGGRVPEIPGLDRVPVFIGIGEHDFLLSSARELRGSLERVGSERVEYREYPDIEHLVIVQVALPDAFEFFDQIGLGQVKRGQ